MIEELAKPLVPQELHAKWQKVVDLMAKILKIPAGLIMKVHPDEIEVFVTSQTENNPYVKGEKASLKTGLYCETVMATRAPLLVPEATKDPVWDHNPDIKLNMTYYLGFPLAWPDGETYGTICVLDSKQNDIATDNKELIEEFSELVQGDLSILMKDAELKQNVEQLEQFNNIMVHRESRIIEMKEEVNRLSRELGREEIYSEIWKEGS